MHAAFFCLFSVGPICPGPSALFNRYTYRWLYASFLLSVLLVFFWIRPLNSPWHRFIAGDGLGYYAYLPATFIYGDRNYDFTWFDRVYDSEYSATPAASGSDHFMVELNGRRVNKYYPGLALLWLPFFAFAHLCALVFQFPANGFSLPYQWAIGAASLTYLFLGLYYLRKLLFRISAKAWLACLVPVFMFYGTPLFDYALNMNSLSHVYAFSLVVAFVYYSQRFFNEEEIQARLFYRALFIFLLIVFIRPLNVIVLLLVPAVLPRSFPWKPALKSLFAGRQLFWLLMGIGFVLLELSLLKQSSGAFLPNTYSAERFDFFQPQLWKALFGFQYGLFLYAPLLCFSLGVVLTSRPSAKTLVPAMYFLLVLYVYSCWWFWPITARASVDSFVAPAMLLGHWFSQFSIRYLKGRMLLVCCVLLTLYYQLKLYQFRNGILDRNYTHAALYLSRFFELHPGLTYAVPPHSVNTIKAVSEGYEDPAYSGKRSTSQVFEGRYAAQLDRTEQYTREFISDWPDFMGGEGLPKIRLRFRVYAEEDMKEAQLYVNICDQSAKVLRSMPFYLKQREMGRGHWRELEVGHEFSREEAEQFRGHRLHVFFWNNLGANSLYIDQLELEYLLCDRSAEIVP